MPCVLLTNIYPSYFTLPVRWLYELFDSNSLPSLLRIVRQQEKLIGYLIDNDYQKGIYDDKTNGCGCYCSSLRLFSA